MKHNSPGEGPVTVYRNLSAEILLDSFAYDGMHRFQERPLDAFHGTYEWLLEATDQEPSEPPSYLQTLEQKSALRLQEWLRNHDDIFWIAGKPGAGKSTLMRWLARHKRTLDLLTEWANGPVVIASYFAWKAGSSLEKSWPGLLRSILFQIIDNDNLLASTCSLGTRRVVDLPIGFQSSWTSTELMQMLRAIFQATERRQFVLFIDGLDEFNDSHSMDHLSLAGHIQDMGKHPSVKIYVASRPDSVIFGTTPTDCHITDVRDEIGAHSEPALSLHTVNGRDISLMIKKQFSDDKQLRQMNIDHDMLIHLGSRVQAAAQGVFLWVVLAVRSIRRGILSGDSHDALHARLRAFPTEVEAFVASLYERIEPVYHKLSAQLFLLLARASRSRGNRRDVPSAWVDFLGRFANDEDFALKRPVLTGKTSPEISWDDHAQRGQMIASKCGGDLVTINQWTHVTSDGDLLKVSDISLAHRTVLDFIDKSHQVLSTAAGSSFHPVLALMSIGLGHAKEAITAKDFTRLVLRLIVSSIRHSIESESPHFAKMIAILLETDRAGMSLFASAMNLHWSRVYFEADSDGHRLDMMQRNKSQADMDDVFWHFVRPSWMQTSNACRSFWLECSLIPVYVVSFSKRRPNLDTTITLLRSVTDPNEQLTRQEFNPYSVWQVWVAHMVCVILGHTTGQHFAEEDDWRHFTIITEEFLKCGANPDIKADKYPLIAPELYDYILDPRDQYDIERLRRAGEPQPTEVPLCYDTCLALRDLLHKYTEAKKTKVVEELREDVQSTCSDCVPGCRCSQCVVA
ncbi:Putative NACHT nucleoside triphosphatase, P-loop containing nucleoside triphosphate hydrolase [Septoria linicola]|uniref:NACHT nucleoside triphosphatase, P-loop containing nucleoside triphosphate hydrolase n=1 Tax=Septoria linicola TaxID=215465 RepID=A0A9Q9EGI3_9PEZI|nr:putative NACHT nucleoside triphosphatase, P-loop containing nucleoside triphosphate hydrolase [Septoria linicola]USW48842.1 Putative NACHT nucleoside triphosphatase, P-loop containing nucleoside triphosphate hydrolase [Septoria linicola]